MEATPHIDLWTIAYVLSDHVGVFRAPDPHIVPIDLPRYMKASFICEHDRFQVIFVILCRIEHFQGNRLAFGSVIWFEFLQNLHLIGIKFQSFMQNPMYSGGWSPSSLAVCRIDFLGLCRNDSHTHSTSAALVHGPPVPF